tara:strand:+ start:346 stop:942 length:597 start_codon:yes stop_codon:yes gene_type:complete
VDLNYNTYSIFPVLIHQFDVNGFDEIQNNLIDHAYDLKEKEPKGVLLSNYGGWQSSGFNIENEEDILQTFLVNCLSNFPVINKSCSMRVEAWVNINKPGDRNRIHDHPSCDLSGVLWIKTPKDCGQIEFTSPVQFQTFNEVESYTQEFKESFNYHHTYYFNPIEGRILVFPSHLQHEVKENKSNEDRISISFNIKFIK